MKRFLLWILVMQIKDGKMSSTDMEIAMLTDVIRSYEKPTVVVANFCWTAYYKRNFIKELGKIETPVTIRISDEWSIFKYTNYEESNMLFIMDVRCNSTVNIFQMANASRIFRNPFRWFIIGSRDDAIPEEIKNLNVLLDAEVLVARYNENGLYNLEFVYKIGVKSNWSSEPYGVWDPAKGYLRAPTFVDSTGVRRRDLQGYVIPIVYVISDPDTVNDLIDRRNPLVDTLTKVIFRTTNYLLDSMNAGRQYLYTFSYGYKINGSWTGMTGYLVREQAEIAGSPLFITAERLPYIDYMTCPILAQSVFVFQQPNLSYENNLFLLSFRTSVWYSLMALLLLIFFVLFLVAYWEWKKKNEFGRSNDDGDSSVLRPKLSDIVLLVLGATCQQGSSVELKGGLGRVVMFVVFLTLMFLYTSYSANIVALLQSSSSQIQTLEDLLNSRIKCSVQDTSYNRYYFSVVDRAYMGLGDLLTTITEATRKAIYQKKVAPPGVEPRFTSLDEGVRNIQKGLHAFHMETGVGYNVMAKYFHESEKCRLREMQYLFNHHPWNGVRKNSPFKEIIKLRLMRMEEHGLQSRENQLLYAKRPKCTGGNANFVSVSMVDCYPVIMVIVYGMILSVFLLAVEILHNRLVAADKLICFST